MTKHRLNKLLAVSTIAGIIITTVSMWAGFDGIRTSVVLGRETSSWPSVQGFGSHTRTSSARLWLFPYYEQEFAIYRYQVNGQWYKNADYDVHGGFVGTQEELDQVRKSRKSGLLIIYYNPDDPSQAVLKPGISFDPMSQFYLIAIAAGLMLTGIGVVGLSVLHRRTRSALNKTDEIRSSADASGPPPLPPNDPS